MTSPTDRLLLESLIDWLTRAAERADRSGRDGESVGLRRAAAKLKEELARGE